MTEFTMTDPAGVPVSSVRQDLAFSRKLRQFLEQRLYGQPRVIDAIADGLVFKILAEEEGQSPRATLFLVGPSGTGKSYTTKLLAELMEGDWPIKSIDMSGLQSANQAFALVGLTQGYDTARPGDLTSFVRANPKCIVVLDNFDKAHPNNQNVLLEMLDTGFLTDQCGFYPGNDTTKEPEHPPEVDFRQAIVIFVSNAASGSLQSPDFQTYLDTHPETANSAVVELLSRQHANFKEGGMAAFAPDLLMRLASQLMLVYRPLDLPTLEHIARNNWDSFVQRLDERFGCKVEAPQRDVLLRAAALSFGGELDARKMAGEALVKRLFGKVIDAVQEADDEHGVTRVVFELPEGYAATLDKLCKELGGAEPVRELRRKQRALDFSLERTGESGSELHLRACPPKWITPLRAGDVGMAGGLQVTVPEQGFDAISGHEQVKARLRHVVDVLKRPQKLRSWGIQPSRGMLLWGPPGTGKTMLARALAKEADLPFISTTGPEMLDLGRMHQVFERARHYAPSILFIDEIDIIGSREKPGGYPAQINQLLTELDGFGNHAGGVFTVAATNYPEKIDPAILRAGRLDLLIQVPALDRPARRHFLAGLTTLPGGDKLDLDELTVLSSGCTGADLQRVKRELGMELIRCQGSAITQEQAVEMINVVKYGERRNAKATRDMLERTAWHEVGHALASLVLRPVVGIELVTIVPRGMAAGLTAYDRDAERGPMTREEVLDDMAVALAGRIAQELKYGEGGIDNGAASDLAAATRLANAAIVGYGLDEDIGYRILLGQGGSPPVASDAHIKKWVDKARERAKGVLEPRKKLIEALAKALLEHETMSGAEFSAMYKRLEGRHSDLEKENVE